MQDIGKQVAAINHAIKRVRKVNTYRSQTVKEKDGKVGAVKYKDF